MAEENKVVSNEKLVNDEDLLKALETILGKGNVSEDDIVIKAEESDNDEDGKKDEESDEEMEKAYSKTKGELEEMEKALELKKGELEEYEKKISKKKEMKKSEEEDIQKSENDNDSDNSDLLKSFKDTLNSISKALETQKESNDELRKSMSELKEENEELRKSMDEIGSQRQGTKSIKNSYFIEKGETAQDENGKSELSVSRDKTQVESVLEKAIDEATDTTIKKSLEDDLLGFNMGGAKLSQNTAQYLYKNYDVRLKQ